MSKQQEQETLDGNQSASGLVAPVGNLIDYGSASMAENVIEFERLLEKQPNKIDLKVEQFYCNGLYGRKIYIPAGTLLTGKVHKDECFNFIMSGCIFTNINGSMTRMDGPVFFPGVGGIKRACHAVTDTVWITVHPNPNNNMGDPEAMADILTFKNLIENKPDNT